MATPVKFHPVITIHIPEVSPDHLLVLAQSLLRHILDEGWVLQVQLCRDRQDEGWRVQDVQPHLGLRNRCILVFWALWRHLGG